jgi:hypothetical protein
MHHDPVLRHPAEMRATRTLCIGDDLREMVRARPLRLRLDGDDETRASLDDDHMVEIAAASVAGPERDPVTQLDVVALRKPLQHNRDLVLARASALAAPSPAAPFRKRPDRHPVEE